MVFGNNLPEVIERDKRRLKTYSKYGYKNLIIQEKELKNQIILLEKIKNYFNESFSTEAMNISSGLDNQTVLTIDEGRGTTPLCKKRR